MVRRRNATGDGVTGAPVADTGAIGDAGGAIDGNTVIPEINPATVDASIASASVSGEGGTGGAEAPKKRGRKPGSVNKKAGASLDLNGVESLLLVIHHGLAGAFGAPELSLNKEEANALAQATQNVARHYDMRASQKALDWGALAVVVFSTYSGRLMQIRMRKALEPKTAKPAAVVRGAPVGSQAIRPGGGAVHLDPMVTPFPGQVN